MTQPLTDSERGVLTAAARRPDGRIHPLPEGVDADVIVGKLVSLDHVELEAGEVEIEVRLAQLLQLGAQQLVIPAGVLGDPVVGEAERPHLRLAQMLEPEHRHGVQLQLSDGQQPAVAADQHTAFIHQGRAR